MCKAGEYFDKDTPDNCTLCPIGTWRTKDHFFNEMKGILDDEACVNCTGVGGPLVVWTTNAEGATNITDCVGM